MDKEFKIACGCNVCQSDYIEMLPTEINVVIENGKVLIRSKHEFLAPCDTVVLTESDIKFILKELKKASK